MGIVDTIITIHWYICRKLNKKWRIIMSRNKSSIYLLLLQWIWYDCFLKKIFSAKINRKKKMTCSSNSWKIDKIHLSLYSSRSVCWYCTSLITNFLIKKVKSKTKVNFVQKSFWLLKGLQNSSQQDSQFYTEQQNLNNSHGQLLA
jgi:hypothetical protein